MATRINPQPTVTPRRVRNTGDASATTAATATTATTPVADAAPAAPVDAMDGTGGASGLRGRARAKLTELTWDALKSGANLGTTLGDDASLGIKVSARVLRGSDSEIATDPHRKAGTDAVRQDGKTPIWVETKGLLQPSLGLNGSLPAGSINLAVGFHTGALAEYRVIRPYGDPDASDAAKGAFELPLDASRAKALVEGTEVELKGRGHARLSATLSAGATTDLGPVSGGVGASIGHAQTVDALYGVKVTKLDGDKVRVSLDEIKGRTGRTTAAVSAGLTINGDEAIDDHLGESINGLDGNKLGDLIQSAGADLVEDAVKDLTAFDASVGKTAREEKQERVSYVLDLSTPDGAAAYEKVLRLDEDGAAGLANKPGVTRSEYDASVSTDTVDASVRFAGQKLVLFNALRAEESGTLDAGGASSLVRSSIASRRYSGFISGEKKIRWEAVDVRDSASTDRFFHMSYTKDDKLTRHGELKDFVRFADGLGIDNAVARQLDLDSTFFVRAFGGADNTDVDVDVYFTGEGIKKIAGTDEASARQAMADAMGTIDPDSSGAPVNDPAARQLVDVYVTNRRNRNRGGRDNNSAQRRMAGARRDYAQQFGGAKLADHLKAFEAADAFGPQVAALNNTGDGQAWTSLLADIGESSKFEYMPSVLALSKLAGADETLVHSLSIKGDGVELVALDEGALQNPSAAVDAALGDAPRG